MSARVCRLCGAPLLITFCDLGMSPLSNAFVKPSEAHRSETFYPLHASVCERCFLVQLEQFETPEHIFKDYAYFSSYSDTRLEHCRRYAEAMHAELGLNARSLVIEVASNDGYLLRNFVRHGIPVLGVEPAANVARVAVRQGVPTRVAFFGRALAQQLVAEGVRPDLVIGNNVLAQVPDLNDFVAGMRALLKPGGVITLEFPHLLRLMLRPVSRSLHAIGCCRISQRNFPPECACAVSSGQISFSRRSLLSAASFVRSIFSTVMNYCARRRPGLVSFCTLDQRQSG